MRRRGLIQEVESLRAKRAEVSRTIGKQDPAAREQLVADMRAVGDRIASLEQELAAAEADFERQMLEVPNLPDPTCPSGVTIATTPCCAARARRGSLTSRRGRTGRSAPTSTSSTSSAA